MLPQSTQGKKTKISYNFCGSLSIMVQASSYAHTVQTPLTRPKSTKLLHLSSLNTLSGNVASLATVVARLVQLVGGVAAVLGNVTSLTT